MASTSDMKNKRKSAKTQDLVEGKDTWVFTDTECKIDRKISFQWNQFFQDLLTRVYQMLLQDDPCMELIKEIYKNISKSGLYRAIANPFILSCLDVVEWMTRKVDHSNMILLNFKENHVARYQPYTIH